MSTSADIYVTNERAAAMIDHRGSAVAHKVASDLIAQAMLGVRVNLLSVSAAFAGNIPAALRGFGPASLVVDAANETSPLALIYIDAEELAVEGFNTKLRVGAQIAVNATAPGAVAYTFGLHPVTIAAGGPRSIAFKIGKAVEGSEVVFGGTGQMLAAKALLHRRSDDLELPAAGHYCLGFATSAVGAATSFLSCSAQLELCLDEDSQSGPSSLSMVDA